MTVGRTQHAQGAPDIAHGVTMVNLLGRTDESPKKKSGRKLTVEERAQLAPYVREKRLEAKDKEERRKQRVKEEAAARHEEWLQKNDPEAYRTYILAGVGIAPQAQRDPLKELAGNAKTLREIGRLFGGGDAGRGGDNSPILAGVETLANSELGRGLGQMLGGIAMQSRQTPQPSQPPQQPQPTQETPMPQANPQQALIDELVGVAIGLLDKPGQGLASPADAAKSLKEFAETDTNLLRYAPATMVKERLGRDLPPEQRVMLQAMVRGILSDLAQTQPTPESVVAWIVDQARVKSPHLRQLWQWFAADEATRVPWLVDVVRHLRGGAPPVAAGPVEAI